MDAPRHDLDGCSAWNPGVGTAIPAEFRSLETIFRPECVFSRLDQVEELAELTGLAQQELTAFRPERLALHEIIVRVTADIVVPEGEVEEAFGRNFRRIAGAIREGYVLPRLGEIERVYAEVKSSAAALVREILAATLDARDPPPTARAFPFGLLRRAAKCNAPVESSVEREHRILAEYEAAGLAAQDPLRRAVYRALHRVLGAIAGRRGRIGADRDLLSALVVARVCNGWGSRVIGRAITPLVDAAIEREGFDRVPDRASPVLISLKGASAAGKSSLRPVIKQIMREQGIEPDGYATISPDVWRRMLLDYQALGPARKYAGHLTSRELMVIDGKLDRYIRDKAARTQSIPHLLVDRFRFDSFSTAQIARVLHATYAKYVDTMYMYFVVTPPEDTVERGWQRALERGRYKAVEDFLGHSVEAYNGMPKILFKWLAYARPDYRYHFLDNRVPKGTLPRTIASGDQAEMTIRDPVSLLNIERYQKIDIKARTRREVYPAARDFSVGANAGFLRECIRRIPRVSFVDPAGGGAYLRALEGEFEVLDAAILSRMMQDEQLAEVLREIAPCIAAVARTAQESLIPDPSP